MRMHAYGAHTARTPDGVAKHGGQPAGHGVAFVPAASRPLPHHGAPQPYTPRTYIMACAQAVVGDAMVATATLQHATQVQMLNAIL